MIASRSVHRVFYLLLLAGIGGAALVRIVATLISLVGIELPGLMKYSACPVPIVCLFDDPGMHVIELVIPTHHNFSVQGDTGLNVGLQYVLWHGGLILALLIVALATRRLLAFRAARSLEAPPSFPGFPFGLTLFGFALVVYGYFGGWGVSYFTLRNPVGSGVMCLFVAFLVTEVSSLRRSSAPGAGVDAVAQTPPRRRPIWSVVSLAVPLIGFLVLGAMMGVAGRAGDGFAGLAAASLGVVAAAIGMGLGAIATLIALLRRERWTALQVAAFVMNFGFGVPMIVHLLRPV